MMLLGLIIQVMRSQDILAAVIFEGHWLRLKRQIHASVPLGKRIWTDMQMFKFLET